MKTPLALVLLALVGACAASTPDPTPAPVGAALRLRENWRATVIVDRDDSIVLTMPTGSHQLQHFRRIAGLTLDVSPSAEVTIRLDSMRTQPASTFDGPVPVGATWSGRLGDPAVNGIRVTAGGRAAAELTPLVRTLLPRLPADGAQARATWTDTGTGPTQSDMFAVTEQRSAKWAAGSATGSNITRTVPIRLIEEFEQIGGGARDGQKVTITSQGRRTGTYYVFSDGRMDRATLEDSAAVSIGVPASRQVMSGVRFVRTEIRFITVRGDR